MMDDLVPLLGVLFVAAMMVAIGLTFLIIAAVRSIRDLFT